MALNHESIQKAFSHLKSSPKLREEILSMTEQNRKPKKYALRRLLVTAAIMALAVAVAMGANAATGGELYEVTIGKLVYTFSLGDGGKAEMFENDDGSFTIIEHPNGEDGETAKKGGDVSYEEFCEVETDEDGNILRVDSGKEPADSNGEKRKVIAAQGGNGLEIGVEKDGEGFTRPIEELMEGTGEIVSLPKESGESSLLGLPWLYDPETGIDGYRQREDGKYEVVVQDVAGELKIIVTDEIPFFIHSSASHE